MCSRIIFFIAILSVVHAAVIIIYDDEAHEVNGDRCNNQECNQRCRRIGFPGGTCENGRCKCDVFRASEDKDEQQSIEDSQNSSVVSSCNNQECNQRCHRIGFPGGFCVQGRCKCDLIQMSEDKLQTNNHHEGSPALNSCMDLECDQKCRRFGMHGGSCVQGHCMCDITRVSEDFASILGELQSLQHCNPQECDQRCRRLKFPGGACVNGRCKCDNFLNASGSSLVSDIVIDETEESVSTLGRVLQAKDIQKLNDLKSSAALLTCNNQECDQRCRRYGFPGGVCVKDRCNCDMLRMSEDNEILKQATCYQYQCNDQCIRIGYAGGLCRKNKCKCY